MNEDIILGGLAIIFTGMVFLVPVLGLTLRFAIKPVIETWAEIQRGRPSADQQSILERRVSMLEGELQSMQERLSAVTEAHEFQRQLSIPLPIEGPAPVSNREILSADSSATSRG